MDRGAVRIIIHTLVLVLSVSLISLTSIVGAARYSSTNYVIDASATNSFGGDGSSTSYNIVGSGGESIVGDGSSGSYKMAAGYVAQLEELSTNSIEITAQPSDLIAYYPLNEMSGSDVFDKGLQALDGTTSGSPSWGSGKLGGAISLNGSTQYISIADDASFASTSTMTISAWVNQSSSATDETIISHWDYSGGTPTSGSWALQTSSGDSSALRFYVADSATDSGNNYVDTATSTWSSGSWRYVTVVYDGSQSNASRVKIYIDGNLASTSTTGTIATSLYDASSPLVIGDFSGRSRFWTGDVDHVKLFDRAFSASEVQAEYDAQNSGTGTGLTLGNLTPGTSNITEFDVITTTDANGYNLAISQNHDLQFGANTIGGVSGTIDTPAAWSEGSTTGLGFSLYTTNATAIPGKWNSGNSYAAIPGSSSTFYTRTGTQSSRDYLGIRLRVDVAPSQVAGDYSQQTTITGTMTP